VGRPVYVLGAGFCLDFDERLFPLAANFLSVAKEQYRYQAQGLHTKLSQFIAMYFGDDTSPDIEKVLSFLASGPLDDPYWISEERSALYNQLVKIICDTLNAASATVKGRANRMTPLPINPRVGDCRWMLYSRFVQELVKRQAIIVTFNYDLLLEFLLHANGAWGMSDGYGIDIPLIYEAFPRVLRPEAPEARENGDWSACLLLKPHGSINWGSPVAAGQRIADRKVYLLPEPWNDHEFGLMLPRAKQTRTGPGTWDNGGAGPDGA
jgi:hypothetical protein